MRLVDCIAQCHEPFIVRDNVDGRLTTLNNTADFSTSIARCPLRYVLTDDLVRLCADLAYSKGARSVACADLLRAPAEALWVEWSNEAWERALQTYGFPLVKDGLQWIGRRGVWIRSNPQGRRGSIRTFWTQTDERAPLASSVEAYFDFDTPAGEDPEPFDGVGGDAGCVYDEVQSHDDVLGRCFRFRYERSWSDYYRRSDLTALQAATLWRHCLGTVAMDVPMILSFLLLLATRSGLPQVPQDQERLNRQRRRAGKPPLLAHIEVRAPLLAEYQQRRSSAWGASRRHPRLHHVRGHLVRRGSQIFWRVPHLRGHARAGVVRTRTVVWTFS